MARKQSNKKWKNKKGKKDEFTKPGKWNQGALNDISWYNQNPILMKIAGLVNFLRRIGSSIMGLFDKVPTFSNQYDPNGITGAILPARLPGVMRLGYLPIPGVVTKATDAINAALDKFFTALRLKNFSTSVYDQADVGFYFLAADSILSFYAFMTMVYNHLKQYKFTNAYYPKAIIKAMNVDFNDLIDHIDDFLFYINMIKEKIEVMKVPKDLHFVARHMHMSAQVYKDADHDKAQLYVFVPDYVWQYDATTPALNPVPVGRATSELTYTDIKKIMDDMLAAILPDEDMNIIAADVVKYYGGETWTVNSLDWDSQLEPVFNKEMLWQIHNADFMPYTSVSGLQITQTTTPNLDTIIYFNPTFTTNEKGIAMERIIDSENDAPDATEVVESTRLKFVITDFQEINRTTATCRLKAAGSEIITGARLIMFNDDETFMDREITTFVQFNNEGTTPNQVMAFPWSNDPKCRVGSDFLSIIAMASFDYRPITYIIGQFYPNNVNKNVFCGILAPLGNYALVESQQLEALHEQCLLSMFNLGARIA